MRLQNNAGDNSSDLCLVPLYQRYFRLYMLFHFLLFARFEKKDFDFLQPLFYKESKASIIVYSLEENELGKNSFDHIKNWVQNLRKYCGEILMILFANKVDLVEEDELNLLDIKRIAEKYNCFSFSLTSAKTGQGVNEAFNLIIQELYNKYSI